MSRPRWIWRNGAIIPRDAATVDPDDRGYQFGDGVYEVVRIYGGRPFLWEGHRLRLIRSAGELGMRSGFADAAFSAGMAELVERENIGDGTLYIQVTRGVCLRQQVFPGDSVDLEVTAYARPMERPLADLAKGIAAWRVADIRWLRCDIKSINLLPNVLARQTACENSCAEALQHRGDILTEGAFSNAYLVRDGAVYTHPADNHILGGITRAFVLRLAAENGITVREKPSTLEELAQAEEVFVTSTTSEIMPVVCVNNEPVGNGSPGVVTRRLQTAFTAALAGTTGPNFSW
ncbi:MAG: D-amino-acid transaminase [Opitutales bacterium]|nr:D-amino-acid transaminase [Opitutales bacterium]